MGQIQKRLQQAEITFTHRPAPPREIPTLEFKFAQGNFGVIPNTLDLSWDHTTDLDSPIYAEPEDSSPHIAVSVAESVLQENDQNLITTSDVQSELTIRRLDLIPNTFNQRQVYDVTRKLDSIQHLLDDPNTQMRRLRVPTVLNSVLIKQKRLSSSSANPINDKKTDKKRISSQRSKSRIQWFVRKLTFNKCSFQDSSEEEENPLS